MYTLTIRFTKITRIIFLQVRKLDEKLFLRYLKNYLTTLKQSLRQQEKWKKCLKDTGFHQPISVIPTGIQLNKFHHSFPVAERAALRNRYNIPKDAFLLLSLGRLGKEKNIEELLYFLSLIKFDIYFLIVGDGPNRDHLMEYTKELGLEKQVVFVGMIDPDEVPIYYQMANLFVSASSSETQGLTYLEALASGIPALCRADEAIENVVINGQTGYQYHSFKGFESCLYYLMHDQTAYNQMALSAQDFAFEHFSAKSILENA